MSDGKLMCLFTVKNCVHIDINQFSSKTLVKTYGEQTMEVREQVLNYGNLAIIFLTFCFLF